MAYVNIASVIAKVNQWAETPEGKAELNRYLQSKASSEGVSTEGLDINVKELDDLLDQLRDAIIGCGGALPASLYDSLTSLGGGGSGGWTNEGTSMMFTYVGELSFGDLGVRGRLQSGEALMLPLFNSGWSASNYAYGAWGPNRIRSRKSFGGLHFVNRGVASFMSSVSGGVFDISVSIGDGWA